MLDNETKRRIDSARSILVGKVPDPKAQVEQITTALIYKFMDDMDREAEELGGHAKFITGELETYTWAKLMSKELSGSERLNLYMSALLDFAKSADIPSIFRTIFKDAFLPYRDPETLSLFLKEIDYFDYDHSENLGNAFEYLLSILGSQGDAGQFRTPRHIIDFIVEVLEPKKNETVLDPACGTAGFLISAYKHIMAHNTLTPDEKKALMHNFTGYDISPDMVRLSLVNMYLHSFPTPKIYEYDTLTSEERWNDSFDVILANPPFMTPKGGIRPHNRFSVQANRSEVLFVDYIAEHLNLNGRAGIIVPEGIIFQSANAYKALRKMLIENNLLWAVVSLPAGIFNPYAGVKTSILLLDRTIAKYKEQILFVKVSNDGFDLGAQRREINKNDLPTALEVLKKYKLGEAIDHPVAQAVLKTKIAESGDYNLTGDRYRENTRTMQTAYPMVKLEDICYIYNGSTPSRTNEDFWNNGTIPWFTIEDIRKQGRIIRATEQKITKAGFDNSSVKLLPKNSILLCCTASVGEYAFAEIELTTNQQFNGLVIKDDYKDRLLPKFLFLMASTFKSELERLSGKTSFNFVSVGNVKQIEIPLPPLEIQNEIVAQIEEWQKIIDGAKQVINTYHPTITIDPSWEIVKLGDVCEITSSKRIFQEEYQSHGIPFYRTKEIVELSNNLNISLELFISENRYNEIKKQFAVPVQGDILISAVGTIGICWIVDTDSPFYFKDGNLLWLKSFKNINSYFLKIILENTIKATKSNLVNGVAYNALTIIKLKEIQVPLPPIEVQTEIIEYIERERQAVESCKKLVEIFEAKIKSKINEIWSN